MKIIILACTFLMSMSAFSAGHILFKAHTFSKTPRYYSTFYGNFEVNYQNLETNFGDRVFIKYGFSGGFESGHSIDDNTWVREKKVELVATAPYEYSANFQEEISARGQFSFRYINFVIIVENSDGEEVIIDNGSEGQKWSFFRSVLGFSSSSLVTRDYSIITLN